MANRGAQLFAAALEARGLSKGEAERFLGAAKGTAGRLLSGERRPGRALAAALARAPWKIPMRSWDEPVSANASLEAAS